MGSNRSLYPGEVIMGDKGKRDKNKREIQKKKNLTLKEKRSQKKDKGKSDSLFSEIMVNPKDKRQ
jgi:hypothetical protein